MMMIIDETSSNLIAIFFFREIRPVNPSESMQFSYGYRRNFILSILYGFRYLPTRNIDGERPLTRHLLRQHESISIITRPFVYIR